LHADANRGATPRCDRTRIDVAANCFFQVFFSTTHAATRMSQDNPQARAPRARAPEGRLQRPENNLGEGPDFGAAQTDLRRFAQTSGGVEAPATPVACVVQATKNPRRRRRGFVRATAMRA